jgi:4-oxalocrotonate tautomerase
MPIVTVQMAGRDVEVKRRLAGEITRVLVEALDVEPEWVTVLFQELERENWASGGLLHSDKYGPGCGRQGTDSTGS